MKPPEVEVKPPVVVPPVVARQPVETVRPGWVAGALAGELRGGDEAIMGGRVVVGGSEVMALCPKSIGLAADSGAHGPVMVVFVGPPCLFGLASGGRG